MATPFPFQIKEKEMIFRTQTTLFQNVLDCMKVALVKSDQANETGQYVLIKAEKGKLYLAVKHQDIVMRVAIDKAPADLLEIGQDGEFAVDGSELSYMFKHFDVADKFHVDFVPAEGKAESKKESDEEAVDAQEIRQLGVLNFNMPTRTKKKNCEVWPFPVAEVMIRPKIDSKGNNRLTLPAATLGKFIGQVELAVGKDSGNASFRNVMIRKGDAKYEVVAASPNMLAWVKSDKFTSSSGGDFKLVALWEQASRVSKMLVPEQDVDIFTDGETIVFCQELLYGSEKSRIGTVEIKISCARDPFAKFENTIGKLDLKWECKLKREHLRSVCHRLERKANVPRTVCVFSPADEEMSFSKKSVVKNASVGVADCKGDALEIILSSQYLKACVDNAESEDIIVKFSGVRSLGAMVLSDELTAFFNPYGAPEADDK